MVWNWLRRHSTLVDAAIAVGMLAVYLGDAIHRHRYALGAPIALLEAVPLLFRRRWPLGVLALVTAGTVASTLAYSRLIPFAAGIAVYTVAAHCSRRRSAWATVVIAGAVFLSMLGSRLDYASLIFFAAAWILGDNMNTRRAYLHELEEKADRLEREREANVRRAAAEEQARIARELHDVVAHSVSVMVVQAAAARDVFETAPERVRTALAAIESTGRSALGELRRVLGLVRGDPEYGPQPSLENVDRLVDSFRAAGLDVELTLEGTPQALPAGVDLSAYRIVQEALTNTLKHAQAHHASVSIRYANDLTVEVRDDGVGVVNGRSAAGHGLVGMRERTAMLGGALDAEPAADGGFVVRACFPLGRAVS